MAVSVVPCPVGVLQTTCYLVWDPATARGVCIDPGDEPQVLMGAIRKAGFEPTGILLTHAHFDHIRAVGPLARHFDIGVALHAGDHGLYASPDNAFPPWIPAAEDLPEPGDQFTALTDLPFTVFHTPGHSPGSVCLYLPQDDVLFSGDTLFQGAVGRTDFPGGNMDELVRSISTQLYTLPDTIRVYPGHGEETTLGVEKLTNPFVRL